MLLERLRFSIPIQVTIDAPADVVWDTLTDISSYPTFLSGVLDAKVNGRSRSSSAAGGVGGATGADTDRDRASFVSNASSFSIGSQRNNNSQTGGDSQTSASNAAPNATNITSSSTRSPPAFLGSKWKITRVSVVEQQKYSTKVTITQCSHSEEDDKRSFTMSTHEMLGATCSLKIIVEPVKGGPPARSDTRRDHDCSQDKNRSNINQSEEHSSQKGRIDPNSPSSSWKSPEEISALPTLSSMSECCKVTVIMTMIPYQYVVKLCGIMCCLCMLKSRARMAMECDLEDLATVCERKRGAAKKEMREKDSLNHDEKEKQSPLQPQEVTDEADVAGGGSSSSSESARSHQQRNLRTIIEENCSDD